MKNIRKVILTFLTLILVLNLSACHSSSNNAKKDVDAFITELRDAKSTEYVSQVYRKYLYTGDGKRTIREEMEVRQGMIQFEPQVFWKFTIVLKECVTIFKHLLFLRKNS